MAVQSAGKRVCHLRTPRPTYSVLLTVRCSIPYNPVFFSYALITPDKAELYIDENKLTPEVKAHLEDKVALKPYDSIFDAAKALGQAKDEKTDDESSEATGKFLLSNKASWSLNLALGGEGRVEEIRSPIADAKAIKNDAELKGMRSCHVRDGAALTEYFAWLENELVNKGTVLDEVDASDRLEKIRSKHKDYVGLSFDTISSTGPNAAVIHYKAERGACSTIDPKAVYLCDSGAQYLDGTTDVTRTLHFGEPTDMEKKAYSLVLKGLIGIDSAVFPKGTTGYAIDAFARQHLWREGLDFLHGTGHGVGSYLVRFLFCSYWVELADDIQNVHEGPMGIGTRVQYADVSLSAGNVISDGPYNHPPLLSRYVFIDHH